MNEPTPWAIISVLLTLGTIATFLLSDVFWRKNADQVFCDNYLLQAIGGFDTLSMKSRVDLKGASEMLKGSITQDNLELHLRRYGFQSPKGECGWLDEPIRRDLADFDACYLNEVSVKNCKLIYMIAAKYGDAMEIKEVIGSHFQVIPCFSNLSEEKLCSK